MSANLALILTVLTFVSGVVVAINRLVWRYGLGPRDSGDLSETDGRAPELAEERQLSGFMMTIVDYSRSFFPVIARR